MSTARLPVDVFLDASLSYLFIDYLSTFVPSKCSSSSQSSGGEVVSVLWWPVILATVPQFLTTDRESGTSHSCEDLLISGERAMTHDFFFGYFCYAMAIHTLVLELVCIL